MEKLKDAKNVRWTESYTDRTEYLHTQFNEVIGDGAYRRWEGKEVDGPGHWYVVVSPADVHEHKRAKFFAGVRKLPDSYPAGGKYFDTIKEAYEYAFETWGTPVPHNVPPFTSGDLRGISKKIKEWEKVNKKEASFDVFLIKTAMSQAVVKKYPWHFDIEHFLDVFKEAEKAVILRIDNKEIKAELFAILNANKDLIASLSTAPTNTVHKILLKISDEFRAVIEPKYESGRVSFGKFNMGDLLLRVSKSFSPKALDKFFLDFIKLFFKENSPINHLQFSDLCYVGILKKSGYMRENESIEDAEKKITYELEYNRHNYRKGAYDYVDSSNYCFAHEDFKEGDETLSAKFAAQVCFKGRDDRKKLITNYFVAGGSLGDVSKVPGYDNRAKRGHFEDNLLSSYMQYRRNLSNVKTSYDFSHYVYSMNFKNSGITYEQFMQKINSDKDFAYNAGLQKRGENWVFVNSRDYPIRVFASFGRNDSSARSFTVSPYNSYRGWKKRIIFSKYSLEDYKETKGKNQFSPLEMAFAKSRGYDFNVSANQENGQDNEQTKANIEKEIEEKSEKLKELLNQENIKKCIQDIKNYLMSQKDVKLNKHYLMYEMKAAFNEIYRIILENGFTETEAIAFYKSLRSAFSGWAIFKCDSVAQMKNFQQEIEGRRNGAFWAGTRATHNSFNAKSIEQLFTHSSNFNVDSKSISPESLISVLKMSPDIEKLDPAVSEKINQFIEDVKLFKDSISIGDVKSLVKNHGLDSVIGLRTINDLFSTAAASGSYMSHVEGVTSSGKNSKGKQINSKLANEFKKVLDNNVTNMTDKTSNEARSYIEAKEGYLSDNKWSSKIDSLLNTHTDAKMPLIKLKRILNSQIGKDSAGNNIVLLRPGQADIIVAKIAKGRQDLFGQYTSFLEPQDCRLSSYVNSVGVSCAHFGFRDYFYYKSLKNRFDRVWKLKKTDPSLYENVLRSFFLPDDPQLRKSVAEISGVNHEENITKIENLINAYFSDPQLGEERKNIYSSNSMFNVGQQHMPEDALNSRYKSIYTMASKGGNLSKSKFELLQNKVKTMLMYDLVTKKPDSFDYIANIGQGIDEKEYLEFLEKINGVLSQAKKFENAQKKERETYQKSLKGMPPEQVAFLMSEYDKKNPPDAGGVSKKLGSAKMLEALSKNIEDFCAKHDLPFDLSTAGIRPSNTEDSISATGVEKSQNPAYGNSVSIGDLDVTKTESILSNPSNAAILTNYKYEDFLRLQALDKDEKSEKPQTLVNNISPLRNSINSYHLAGAYMRGHPSYQNLEEDEKKNEQFGLQFLFGYDSQGNPGASLYQKLVHALAEAVPNRRSKNIVVEHDMMFSKDSAKYPWYLLYNTKGHEGDEVAVIFANYLAHWIVTKSLPSYKNKSIGAMTPEILGSILDNMAEAHKLFEAIGFTVAQSEQTLKDNNSVNSTIDEANSTVSSSQEKQDEENEKSDENSKENKNIPEEEESAASDNDKFVTEDLVEDMKESAEEKESEDSGEEDGKTPPAGTPPESGETVPPPQQPTINYLPKSTEPQAPGGFVPTQEEDSEQKGQAPNQPGASPIPPVVDQNGELSEEEKKKRAVNAVGNKDDHNQYPEASGKVFIEKLGSNEEKLNISSALNLLRVAEMYNRRGMFEKAACINSYVRASISKDAGFEKRIAVISRSLVDLVKVSENLQKEGKVKEAMEINKLVKKYINLI